MKKNKFLSLLLLFFAMTAKAQVYSLSPLLMEVEIAPGESKDFPIKVTNLTNGKLEGYGVVVDEFIYNDKTEKADYKNIKKDKNPRSLVNFAKLGTNKFDVDPRSTTAINLNITVPKDMKGSGYLRYTIIQALKSKSTGMAIKVKENYTGIVLVKIRGTEERKYELENLKYEKNKVSFNLKNTGNVYLKLKANAFILKNNKKTTKINVSNNKNEQEFYIFPDKIRPLSFNVDPKLIPAGKEKTKILINFFDDKSKYSTSKIVEVSK